MTCTTFRVWREIKSFLRRFSAPLSLIITLDWPTSTEHRKKPEHDYFFFIALLNLRFVAKIRVLRNESAHFSLIDALVILISGNLGTLTTPAHLHADYFVLIQETRKSDSEFAISTRTCLERNCKGERRNEQKKTRLPLCVLNGAVKEKRNNMTREFEGAKSTDEARQRH